MFLKGKNLIKLHNCFSCHKNHNFYPKIKSQYLDYLIWSFRKYQKYYLRKNFLMNSQTQNISIFDIRKILIFINKNN